MRKMRNWFAVLGISACMLAMAAPEVSAYAATEPTYELTEDTAGAEAYVGVVVDTDDLNVRTGPGTTYEQIVVNGEKLKIYEGDKVAIIDIAYSSGGNTWYEIRWVEDGAKYHGYVSGIFMEKTSESA